MISLIWNQEINLIETEWTGGCQRQRLESGEKGMDVGNKGIYFTYEMNNF